MISFDLLSYNCAESSEDYEEGAGDDVGSDDGHDDGKHPVEKHC